MGHLRPPQETESTVMFIREADQRPPEHLVV